MGRRRLIAAITGLLLVAAPTLAACGGGAQTQVGSDQAFVSGDGSIVEVAAADRQPAPPITGQTLTGESFSLADHVGDVVVLNVWASWCAPCRSEAPALADVAADTRGKGVQLVGLVTRDSDAASRAFVDRFQLDYPHVIDSDGALQLQFRETLPPQAIPSTLIIDKQGRVAARVLGEVSAPTLRGLVEPLQQEPS
jgi:peroxiredoxin